MPEGIVVSKEEMKVHTLRTGQNQWDGNFQQHIRLYLGEYLPSAVQMENGDVRFTMNDSDHEIVARSVPFNRSWSAVAPLMPGFQQAMDRFLATANDEAVDPTIREMVQSFQLPSPVTMPEAWRIARGSKGPRLLVLWGFESNAGDGKEYSFLPAVTGGTIPLENQVKRLFAPGLVHESRRKRGSWFQKFLALLLLALLALLGFFLWKLIQVSSPSYEVSVTSYESLKDGQGAQCSLAVQSSTDSPLPDSVEWFVDGEPVPDVTGPVLERQFDPKNHEVKAAFSVRGKNYAPSSNLFVCKGSDVLVIDRRPVKPTVTEDGDPIPYDLVLEPVRVTDEHQIVSRFSVVSPAEYPLPTMVDWTVDGTLLADQKPEIEVTLPFGFHQIDAGFKDEAGKEHALTDVFDFSAEKVAGEQKVLVINPPPTGPTAPVRPENPVLPPPSGPGVELWAGPNSTELFDYFGMEVLYLGIEDGKRVCSFELKPLGDYTAKIISWETDGDVQKISDSQIERALGVGSHRITVYFRVVNSEGTLATNQSQITQGINIGAVSTVEPEGRFPSPKVIRGAKAGGDVKSETGVIQVGPPADPELGGTNSKVGTEGLGVTSDGPDGDVSYDEEEEEEEEEEEDEDAEADEDEEDEEEVEPVTEPGPVAGPKPVIVTELPPISADELPDYFDLEILHIGNRDGKGRYSFELVPLKSCRARVSSWKIDKKRQKIGDEPVTKSAMIKSLEPGSHRVTANFEIYDEYGKKFEGDYSTSKNFEVGNVEESGTFDEPLPLVNDGNGHWVEKREVVTNERKEVPPERPHPVTSVTVGDFRLSYVPVSTTPTGCTYSFAVISEDALPAGIEWLVDDRSVGYGDTLEYTLKPGTYNVTAKIPTKDGKFLKPTVSFTVETVTIEE